MTYTLKTQASIKTEIIVPTLTINNFLLLFKYILYIYYQVYFIKDQAKFQALLNIKIEINAMILAYISKLGFKIRVMNVRT